MAPRLLLPLLLLLDVTSVTAWSRIDASPKQMRTVNGVLTEVRFTCGGAVFTPEVKRTMKNENPDIEVSLLARIPLQGAAILFFNGVHVYAVLVIIGFILLQLIFPKGTEKHMLRGRIVSYGIMPWFFPFAWVLNFLAIFKDVNDYLAAPAVVDWRGQVSYIIPFGLHTPVVSIMAFYMNRHPKCTSAVFAKPLKYVMAFSMFFGLTFGQYMNIDTWAGGKGNFGIGKEMGEDGPITCTPEYGCGQQGRPFYQWIAALIFVLQMNQATLDLLTFTMLDVIEKTGNDVITWHDQHKMSVCQLMFQVFAITGAFTAYFPFCLYGWGDFFCIHNPFLAVPVVGLFESPLLPHMLWMAKFNIALFKYKVYGVPFVSPTPPEVNNKILSIAPINGKGGSSAVDRDGVQMRGNM